MITIFKARRSVFYSLLFVSIVCESFAAFGKAEPGNSQIAESDSPREVLKKALSAAHNVTSYRIRIEAPSGSKTVTIKEYASPDRIRWFDKDGEMIVIGNNTYLKKAGGSWQKYPERKTDVSRTNLPASVMQAVIGSLAKADDIKFIGKETVDGVPTLSYQYEMRPQTGPETMKTWIGVADGLLRRWEFETYIPGSDESTVAYTYYDYNADIKIEPPTEYVSVPFPVPETVLEPKRDELVVTGLPTGVPGPPSLGPGRGGGMGAGSGGGMGPGRGAEPNPNAPATNVDSKPVLLNSPQPRYTREARENNVQGTVTLRILIGADGSVKRVSVVRGLPYGLDEQAIVAAYQLRFTPAMKGGQPVAYQQTVLMEFNLRK